MKLAGFCKHFFIHHEWKKEVAYLTCANSKLVFLKQILGRHHINKLAGITSDTGQDLVYTIFSTEVSQLGKAVSDGGSLLMRR